MLQIRIMHKRIGSPLIEFDGREIEKDDLIWQDFLTNFDLEAIKARKGLRQKKNKGYS